MRAIYNSTECYPLHYGKTFEEFDVQGGVLFLPIIGDIFHFPLAEYVVRFKWFCIQRKGKQSRTDYRTFCVDINGQSIEGTEKGAHLDSAVTLNVTRHIISEKSTFAVSFEI